MGGREWHSHEWALAGWSSVDCGHCHFFAQSARLQFTIQRRGGFWVIAVNFFLVGGKDRQAVWWEVGSLGWYLCELKPDGKWASRSEIKILCWHGNALNSAACGITSLVCSKRILMDVGHTLDCWVAALERWYCLFFSLPVYVIYVSIQTKWQVSWWHFHTCWLGWLTLFPPSSSLHFFLSCSSLLSP